MKTRAFVAVALVGLFVGMAVEGVPGAQTVRYSGTLVTLDAERGTAVIEEVGPWQVKDSRIQVIRRTLVLTPATEYTLFMRVNAPDGFPGAFIEGALEAGDLAPGDFVTAECRLERGKLVAVKISWADPAEPAR